MQRRRLPSGGPHRLDARIVERIARPALPPAVACFAFRLGRSHDHRPRGVCYVSFVGARVTAASGQGAPRAAIAVVVPCYRVVAHVLQVIAAIGPEVDAIYCVDDACPERSGDVIEAQVRDPRVTVLRHARNQGVGGAVMTGYRRALLDGMAIVVKIDGDGQMDPALIGAFIAPIAAGDADYAKGNRFWDMRAIRAMPAVRRVGNLGLSFLAKLSSGYWDIFDPTNGYTAIHATVLARLPFESISSRYFFETDMLFRLNTLRAAVIDVPMDARYSDEVSNLKISRVVGEFLAKHARNTVKRIAYNYFLRDFSVASLELVIGAGATVFGLAFGGWHWWHSAANAQQTPVGTVMIAMVALVSGLQLLLAFVSHDIGSVPRRALHPALSRVRPDALPRTGPLA